MSDERPTPSNFPIRSKTESDPRFSAGLLFDVAAVLERHGYPPVDRGDWADLKLALYRFLHLGRDS